MVRGSRAPVFCLSVTRAFFCAVLMPPVARLGRRLWGLCLLLHGGQVRHVSLPFSVLGISIASTRDPRKRTRTAEPSSTVAPYARVNPPSIRRPERTGR